ncbi:MAG: hypothetical protein LBK29_01365 [Oscillospiraceae bacterium]|nr:hypothetical protein [Oscillospiraceae bacterium]
MEKIGSMIEKIIDADRKTSEILDSAERLRVESAKKVDELLARKRVEYLEKARMNIKVIEKIEKVKSESKISEIDKNCEVVIKEIEKNYEDNKDSLVEKIVKEVIMSI